MPKINLIPWREERQKNLQREFQGMLALSALGGAALSGLLWFYFAGQIENQESRNSVLQEEISNVEKQIIDIEELDKQKNRLLARKKIIDQLQSNRSQMVHMFDSLVRTIPDGVVLTSLKQEGNLITLQGTTQSNALVSQYMRKLENSGWMADPDLKIIQTNNQNQQGPNKKQMQSAFTLKVTLVTPTAADIESNKKKAEVNVTDNVKIKEPSQEADQSSDAAQPNVGLPASEQDESGQPKLESKGDTATDKEDKSSIKKDEADIVKTNEIEANNKSKDNSISDTNKESDAASNK